MYGRRLVPCVLGSLAAFVFCGCAGSSTAPPGGAPSSSSPHGIVVVQGDGRLPDQSAADWVTFADYVVVVAPTSQAAVPAPRSEVERGAGTVLRKLRFRVHDVVWRRPRVAHPAPTAFDWLAFGWALRDDSKRLKMAGADEPRFELGHTYIMALEWEPPYCQSHHRHRGAWRGLGPESSMPFDDGIVNNGELEGRVQTPDEVARSLDPADPNFSLRDAMNGKGIDDLRNALQDAKPRRESKWRYLPRHKPCVGK